MQQEIEQEAIIHGDFLKDCFKLGEKLGSGSYGIVYKAQNLTTNQLVAIKCCKGDVIRATNPCNQLISASTLREIVALKQLSHENILKLIGVKYNIKDNFMYLIFEYCEMDLFKFLYRSQRDFLQIQQIRQIFYEILQGLQYMHMNGLLHRDIKPSNILLKLGDNLEITAKLADFGLVRNILPVPYSQIELQKDTVNQVSHEIQIFNESKILTTGCCTLLYRAIEMLLGETKYSFGIDIWSCGCVLYELIMGKPLFNSDSQFGMIIAIFKKLGMPTDKESNSLKRLPYYSNKWPQFKRDDTWLNEVCEKTNPQCVDLLSKMLELDPVKRINTIDVLLHPFFYQL